MKLLTKLLILIPYLTFSQTNTEVYLFDLKKLENTWSLTNGKNISNNKGYDSQPHFYDDNTIIYASNRNEQTDIAKYNINTKKTNYVNNTPNGGEYSPQRIPNSKNISAVRLDKNGKQRFYQYDYTTGSSTELIKDLVVAYPSWYDQNTVVSSVIENDSLALFISDLKKKTNTLITKQTGRSFHKIPNSNLVSFVKKSFDDWQLWSLNPKTKDTKLLVKKLPSEDMCWMPDGSILIPYKNMILRYDISGTKKWNTIYTALDENINNITRIIVNTEGTKVAFVAEASPRYLAQEQLDAYNNRDIEAFLAPYDENITGYTFPNKFEFSGKEKMREIYTRLFKNTPDLHCKLINRIVQGNIIIDEELVTVNGSQFKAIAIYEVKNGKIITVRFVQ